MDEQERPLILVVDDDFTSREVLCDVLQEVGNYRVERADSGEQALQLLQHKEPELILLDVVMPGMDGYELCRRIKREPRLEFIPVLFLSAKEQADDLIEGYEAGAAGYIFKPFDGVVLLARIETHLKLGGLLKKERDLNCELEAKVAERTAQLQNANRAKDQFLATMSHELRTPLTNIIGNGELLLESELNAEQYELLRSMEGSGKHLLALINDILDLSKIESGKFEIDTAPFAVDTLLDDLQEMFQPRAEEAELVLEVGGPQPPQTHQLWGDGQRISQILINLLSNAIKFTEQGKVSLHCGVGDGMLCFTVEDSGIGMTPEVLERLFKPFEQADNSISRRFGGTGLGLHISYALAQQMEGAIEVSSEPGRGSRFVLQIPYRRSELLIKRAQAPASSSEQDQTFRGSVLVVEDTPELQLLEQRILTSMGATVSLASNGQEAVELVNRQHFDLILMDMQMPVMDGIEATRILQQQGHTVPVVALTANVMEHHREQFTAAGASGFLNKTIEREALRKVVVKHLKPQQAEADTTSSSSVPGESDTAIPVLAIDDEQSVLDYYRMVIESKAGSIDEDLDELKLMLGSESDDRKCESDYSLVTASQGLEGVELATEAMHHQRPFPVAFIDMRMPPGIDGLETARRLRAVDPSIFIVVVTAYADHSLDEVQRELGEGVFFINKPFSKREVLPLLELLIAHRKRGSEEKKSDTSAQLKRWKGPASADQRQLSGDILYAEDTPLMQTLVRKMLEKMGLQVTIANNGQEAVDLVNERPFNLILMDMQMPVMDGIEATRVLRNRGCHLPIIPLTANVLDEYREAFQTVGCTEFLTKPVDREKLYETLRRHLLQ